MYGKGKYCPPGKSGDDCLGIDKIDVLMAKDVSESVEFYRTLGFSLAFQDQAVQPRYAGVVRDGIELHIQGGGRDSVGLPH